MDYGLHFIIFHWVMGTSNVECQVRSLYTIEYRHQLYNVQIDQT